MRLEARSDKTVELTACSLFYPVLLTLLCLSLSPPSTPKDTNNALEPPHLYVSQHHRL